MQITEKKIILSYYQAFLNREARFIGIFYVAVKTTQVFCISTCSARKPKLESVEFYTTFKDALDQGYRPCKICKPTQNTFEVSKQVEEAIQMVQTNLKEKVSDFDLKKKQIAPELVRRWFKSHYGITFHTFQRMFRINNAFQELKSGKTVIDTAFENGYESLSGFGYTYKKLIGKSPKHNTQKNIILINRFNTPLGPMFVCANDDGVCLLEFVDRRMLETEFQEIQKLFNAKIMIGDNKHIQQTQQEIKEYFDGIRKNFELKLQTPGTDFQKLVWEKLKDIPYGTTSTYQKQAEQIQRPLAYRAVGTANGHNRLAIVIPCHRVIGKNGQLAGYAGGLERKSWLLEHEKKHKIH